LEALTNQLGGVFAPTNGNFQLETNFEAYAGTQYDLSGYAVQYDGPTTYDATVSASSSAADQSGLSNQETAFDTLVANLTDFSGNVLDTYPAVDMTFDFGPYVPAGTAQALGLKVRANDVSGSMGTVMDCDPLHSAWGTELFGVVKKLFTCLEFLRQSDRGSVEGGLCHHGCARHQSAGGAHGH
jgi:hypothetical protein